MDRFRTMHSFTEVIKLGSISEAAKTLGLSRALISRHVTDLESKVCQTCLSCLTPSQISSMSAVES